MKRNNKGLERVLERTLVSPEAMTVGGWAGIDYYEKRGHEREQAQPFLMTSCD